MGSGFEGTEVGAQMVACRSCQQWVAPVQPPWAWRLLAPFAYAFAVVMLLAGMFLGLAWLLLLPVVLASGMAGVVLHTQSAKGVRCPLCQAPMPYARHVSSAAHGEGTATTGPISTP